MNQASPVLPHPSPCPLRAFYKMVPLGEPAERRGPQPGKEQKRRTWQPFGSARPPPRIFPFLKSPQLKEGLLPPSCRLPRGPARGVTRWPSRSLGWFGCEALASVSLWCHRFHFPGEKEERQRETGKRRGTEREGSCVRCKVSRRPVLRGHRLPAAPSPDLPLACGFSESRSRGQRASSLCMTLGKASHLLILGSFPTPPNLL